MVRHPKSYINPLFILIFCLQIKLSPFSFSLPPSTVGVLSTAEMPPIIRAPLITSTIVAGNSPLTTEALSTVQTSPTTRKAISQVFSTTECTFRPRQKFCLYDTFRHHVLRPFIIQDQVSFFTLIMLDVVFYVLV